jgi:zinc-ribbon domain
MFCPSCGAALASKMKFCNRCGANLAVKDLAAKDQVELIKTFEKRMDSEMEGLFWITVMGMAAIFGGAALLKKLQLSEFVIVGFMIFGAIAFLGYFGLGVWQVRRLARRGEEVSSAAAFEQEPPETRELNPAQPLQTWETASVTENTTRTLEPVSRGNDH